MKTMTNLVAFTPNSQTSTLVLTPLHPAVEKKAKGEKFLALFTHNYKGDARFLFFKMVLEAVAKDLDTPIPVAFAKKEKDSKIAAMTNTRTLRQWSMNRTESNEGSIPKYLTIKKQPSGLSVTVPVGVSSNGTVGGLFVDFLPYSRSGAKSPSNGTDKLPTSIEVSNLLRPDISPELLTILRQCLKGCHIETVDNGSIVFLEFLITPLECEILYNTPFDTLRLVDMYPLLRQWADADFIPKQHATNALPLKIIASTLPKVTKQTRVDSYGITIDMEGKPMYLPVVHNEVDAYEAQVIGEMQHPDGTYGEVDIKNKIKAKLPTNKILLVDYINNKFTYTNTSGNVVTTELSRFRACNAQSAMNILFRYALDKKTIERFEIYSKMLGVSVLPTSYSKNAIIPSKELQEMRGEGYALNNRLNSILKDSASIKDYYLTVCGAYYHGENTPMVYLLKSELFPVLEFLKTLCAAILKRLDVVCSQYSVSNVLSSLGFLQLISSYCTPEGLVEAKTVIKPYTSQAIDKDWKLPALPLVGKVLTEQRGLLPHQVRGRNLMKDDPDLGVYDYSAGGGKTLMGVTDVLDQLAKGAEGPFAVMCPSTLIANYVSEIVYFTEGRLNAIPVTSFNIRQSGFERYREILNNAPKNTILIIDYDALKYRAKVTAYGTTPVFVYPVQEFLKEYGIQYVFMDESHFLKNLKSGRARAVLSLVADIKKKRIASGTLNPDSPSDLPGQMALLDPTILGSRDEFNEKYGLEVKGNRVIKWRTSGEVSLATLKDHLKNNTVWATAKRKEWASLLPERHDAFLSVQLTERQKEFYDGLFEEMVSSIVETAEKGKGAEGRKAKRAIDVLTGKKKAVEENEDSEDEEDIDAEQGELIPYLSVLEQFITDPSTQGRRTLRFHAVTITEQGERIVDPLETVVEPLTGDDLKSPKAKALEEILREHTKNGKKVLVFTNYNNSTNILFEAMPADLRAKGINYKTSSKEQDLQRFASSKYSWMIGIRDSLETGLNLQSGGCSTLVRIEGCWTPGEQEQGDSRIFRPDLKNATDSRDQVLFLTIIADTTYDVTKAARLKAKQITIAQFDNTGDSRYENIPAMPVIPMKLFYIKTMNNFKTNLADYQHSMSMLQDLMLEDIDVYCKQQLKEGGLKPTLVTKAKDPEGCAILSRVPYCRGTELYAAKDLGLVRLDVHLGLEAAKEEEEEDSTGDTAEDTEDTEENDSVAIKEQKKALAAPLLGLPVHCDAGDGVIIGVLFRKLKDGTYTPRSVKVRFDDFTVMVVNITAAFLITRTETNGKDMRELIAGKVGFKTTVPIKTNPIKMINRALSKKALREKEQAERTPELLPKVGKKLKADLFLEVMNGYLHLSYYGSDEAVKSRLEAMGLRKDSPWVQAYVPNAERLAKWGATLQAKKFTFDRSDIAAMKLLSTELKNGGLTTHKHILNVPAQAKLQQMQRLIRTPSADPKAVRMYPLICDANEIQDKSVEKSVSLTRKVAGKAYITMPLNQAATKKVIAVQVPGITWRRAPASISVSIASKKSAITLLNRIVRSGISIGNAESIKDYLAKFTYRNLPNAKQSEFAEVDEKQK